MPVGLAPRGDVREARRSAARGAARATRKSLRPPMRSLERKRLQSGRASGASSTGRLGPGHPRALGNDLDML
jgi:hypothetical protein